MALDRIVTIIGLLLPLVQTTTIPVDQTLMFKKIDLLLRRCPCVPINTCYSQGVNLNEQTFLNLHFQCPDHTYNHCCGPYFPTLGSGDFYFDEGLHRQNASRGAATSREPKMLIVMARNFTTLRPEPLTKVVLVYPETTTMATTTTTTTTEAAEETTTEFTTVEPTGNEAETTMMDENTTTEPVTTMTPSTTSTTESTTTTTTPKTTLSPMMRQRMTRLQNRPPFPKPDLKRVRSTKAPRTTTTTTSTTTSTTSASTPRIFPTRTALGDSEFHRRYIMSRLRMLAKSTTSTTTMRSFLYYYDDDYYDDDYYDD